MCIRDRRDTWKRMVGITLAYAGLVGLRTLDQHRTNGWQLSWPDEQNDIGLTSFVDVGHCRQNASVGPTNDCYLGMAHFRLWRYNNVAYKSQKCKGMHLIDRDRLSNINYRSIHISKEWVHELRIEFLFFSLLLKCSWPCKNSPLGLINMI